MIGGHTIVGYHKSWEGISMIHLFGSFEMDHADTSASIGLGAHGRRLFSFLLSFPNRNHRRERLADLFWPELDPERTRNTLNTALWRVRKTLHGLADGSAVSLVSGHRDVRLSLAEEDLVDVHCFTRLTGPPWAACNAGVKGSLRAAVELYRGPYLDGDDDDWIVEERERYHCLYVRALSNLMRGCAREGHIEEALDYGRRILAVDPLRERVQRDVMLLYVLNGQGAKALHQFERCADLLRNECGVEPIPETLELVAMIRDGTIFSRLTALKASAFSEKPGRTLTAAPADVESEADIGERCLEDYTLRPC